MPDPKDKDNKPAAEEKIGTAGIDLEPVDIIRWPNMEHRFSSDSPVRVGLISPINVGFGDSPVQVGFEQTPANVNMNIVTPNAVGVSLLGTQSPIALRIVIPEAEQVII